MFSACTDEELVEAMDRLHGLVCLAQRRLLAGGAAGGGGCWRWGLLAEYDRRRAWKAVGATSMGAWVACRLGVAHRTGAEWGPGGGSGLGVAARAGAGA